MQADAEANELQRLHSDANALERMAAVHRDSAMQKPKGQSSNDAAHTNWHLLAAENVLACHHLDRTLRVMEEVNVQLSGQRLRVNETRRECRQMERLVESAARAQMVEAGRVEQRMLDDLFSARHVSRTNQV